MSQVVYPYKPHKWQDEVHRNLKRFNVLVCHRRFGKTVMAINTLILSCLRCGRSRPRYAYIAPQLKQAKAVAWDYLREYAGCIPGAVFNESELRVDFPSGGRVSLYGSDNPDAIRGIYLDGVVMDEVAQMRPEVWSEIVRPTLADRKGWAIFIGTPKGINAFYELWLDASLGLRSADGVRVKSEDWYGRMFPVTETDVLDKEELDSARMTMNDSRYRQEFMCDFSASNEDALIHIDLVENAAKKKYPDHEILGSARVLGVDIARFGNDRSAIQRRLGLQAFQPRVFKERDNMEMVANVIAEINAFHPDAVFIDAGRGEGVIDRLRQLGFSVIEVNFGGSPGQKGKYENKRAEMWDTMRQWLEDGGALPQNDELKKDLSTPVYDYDSAGRLRLETKAHIKERGLPSPDLGDALALTFAAPVGAKSGPQQHLRKNQPVKEYDPLAETWGDMGEK